MIASLQSLGLCKPLARWRGVDNVEQVTEVSDPLQGVSLVKLEWVSWLQPVVDANHIEAGTMVPHGAPTGPTEQIQQLRFHCAISAKESMARFTSMQAAPDTNSFGVQRRSVKPMIARVLYFSISRLNLSLMRWT